MTPTVTIGTLVPADGTKYQTINASGENQQVETTLSGRTIKIYPDASSETTGSGCDQKTTITVNRQAQVTLQLNGLGEGNKATLNFTKSDGGTVYLYTMDSSGNKANNTGSYEWTKGTSAVTRIVGDYQSDSSCSVTMHNAGTLTSDSQITIECTFGSTTFNATVPVEAITIIQE